MRVIAVLLALVAVALSAYSYMEVRRLDEEVATLRARVARESARSAGAIRARELLRQAEAHSARAQELMRQGKLDAARREMETSISLMSETARETGDTNLVVRIRESAGQTIQRIEALLSRTKHEAEAPKR